MMVKIQKNYSMDKTLTQIVKDTPNDMELGARVRWYIKWLYEGKKDAEEKSNSSKWSA